MAVLWYNATMKIHFDNKLRAKLQHRWRPYNGCMIWTGTASVVKRKRYKGLMWYEGRKMQAAQAFYCDATGADYVPRMQLRQTCGNGLCVNPDHQEPGRVRKGDTVADMGAVDRRRFDTLVDRTDGCWGWQGSVANSGYGRFCFGGTSHATHRVSYTLNVGPIPEGGKVGHTCGNRTCTRPDHLILTLPY